MPAGSGFAAATFALLFSATGPHETSPKDWAIDVTLEALLEHSDNLFLDRTALVSDQNAELRPSIVGRYQRPKFKFHAGYEPVWYLYRDQRELDGLFHDSFARLTVGEGRLRLDASAALDTQARRFGNPDDITADLIQQQTYEVHPTFRTSTGKTKFLIGSRFTLAEPVGDPPDTLLTGPSEVASSISYRRAMAYSDVEWQAKPKLSLLQTTLAEYTDFRGGVPDSFGAGDTRAVEARLGIKWQPRSRLVATVYGGARHLDFDSLEPRWHSTFGGTLTTTMARAVETRLEGRREVTSDAFGNPITNHTVSGTMTWELSSKIGVRARAWWQAYEYTVSNALLDDDLAGARLRLEYRPIPAWGFHCEYLYNWNGGKTAFNDYTVNRLRFGVLYGFTLPRGDRGPSPE